MALNEKVNQRVFHSQAIMAASPQTADTLTAMVASLSRAKSCHPPRSLWPRAVLKHSRVNIAVLRHGPGRFLGSARSVERRQGTHSLRDGGALLWWHGRKALCEHLH